MRKKTHKHRRKRKHVETEPARDAPDGAEQKFVEDSIVRGDAALPDEEGKLPLDATHEIVEEGDGSTTLRRRRFRAF